MIEFSGTFTPGTWFTPFLDNLAFSSYTLTFTFLAGASPTELKNIVGGYWFEPESNAWYDSFERNTTVFSSDFSSTIFAGRSEVEPAPYFGQDVGSLTFHFSSTGAYHFTIEEIGTASFELQAPFASSAAVPEPGTWLLLLLAFTLAGASLRNSRASRRTNRAH